MAKNEKKEKGKAAVATKPAPQEQVKDPVITTKELSAELGVSGTALRKILRAKFYPDGVFTRYGWAPTDPLLLQIRAAVQGDMTTRETKKADSATAKAERASKRRKAVPADAAIAEEGDVEGEEPLEELEEFEELEEEEEGEAGENSDDELEEEDE